VRDEDQRLALIAQAADDVEQLVDLLRREHGGRLVEDEKLGAPIEHLEYLDSLLKS